MELRDPLFPNLPYVSDEEYEAWSKEKKARRHTQEIAEAARIFNQLQDLGIDPFEAAEMVPTPRANRRGRSSAELHALYQVAPAPPAQSSPGDAPCGPADEEAPPF
jgi:hypothetical protein